METRPTMFTRKEVSKLTGLSPSQIRYLYDSGMVRFQKVDPSIPNSAVLFPWNTLLEYRAIADLRSLGISLQKLRKAKNYLLDQDPDANLSRFTFALLGEELLLVQSDEVASKLLVQVTGRNVGQFILLPVADLQNELDRQAKILKIYDWSKRRNTKTIQVA
jgi:DNA-binding transcriptional MerR regulator